MYWLFKITDKVCIPIAILGIVIYYTTDVSLLLCICVIWLLAHSVLNCVYGGQNNLVTEVMTFFVGGIIAYIFKINFVRCVAVAFCYAEVLFAIPGVVLIAHNVLFRNKRNQ